MDVWSFARVFKAWEEPIPTREDSKVLGRAALWNHRVQGNEGMSQRGLCGESVGRKPGRPAVCT